MVRYEDMLGTPYQKMDCLAAVCEMLRRFGRSHAASNLEEGIASSAILLGEGTDSLKQDGDVYYFKDGGEESVAIKISDGKVLTSLRGHHVRLLSYGRLPEDGKAYRFIE